MAMTCNYLKNVAYSDSIWQRFFRERWPLLTPSPATSAVREAYLSRRKDCLQFKFDDPLVADFCTNSNPYNHVLLGKNHIIFSQASAIKVIEIDSWLSGTDDSAVTLSDHNARITSMRLFPLNETSLYRSGSQKEEDVLVTSSCDHSIRLWWKGSCRRCFKGHNGPVSALSDKLLGNETGKVLASGGEDGTVRLWSFSSSGKRGQHALKATFYGHEKPIQLMSVGHNTSLLVTVSRDSKVRVWDTNTSSSVRSSCCVGMTSILGPAVDIKCHEQLVYVAAGCSVMAIDLRTMQKLVIATVDSKLYSFQAMPSNNLFCVGGNARAMLYDIRRNPGTLKSEPIAELDGGQTVPVTYLHMDPYKIVTGSPKDPYVNVWEANTGVLTNSLTCGPPVESNNTHGCCALAVNGCRIVTGMETYAEDVRCLRFRDFTNASCPFFTREDEHVAKFWYPQSYSDTDSSQD